MNLSKLFTLEAPLTENIEITFSYGYTAMVYPKSLIKYEEVLLFLAKTDLEKSLYIVSPDKSSKAFGDFNGDDEFSLDNYYLIKCPLTTANRQTVQKIFAFTRPQLIGIQNSFGFGDRLGLANPGHLKALSGSDFKPVLAQQSIRELIRTRRQPEEVMDAAVWAIMQEGYRDGFGADADHLKTTEDIDRMVKAGFTMFTIDPGDHVDNQAEQLEPIELEKRIVQLPWEILDDSLDAIEQRYLGKKFQISEELVFHPSKNELYRALIKYGKALAHIKVMADHLGVKHPQHPSEIEVSVDETESVTTPFDHFFIVSELKRLNVPFVSLAPRFIGSFEKGIDYRGDMDVFKQEYSKHVKISEYFGSYKISLHSGSDKFTVYRIIGSLAKGHIHVKTAGTSYLEALRVLAAKVPDFFRQLLDFSRDLYEIEKKSYHVSADLSRVPAGENCTNEDLMVLFNNDDARQVLHVTFGRVLTEQEPYGSYLFRDKILDYLKKYEDNYDQFLMKHFKKHLGSFQP